MLSDKTSAQIIMKCTLPSHPFLWILLLIAPFISNTNLVAQQNQWTWMSGSNAPYEGNVYGTKGIAAPDNVPGGRWAGQTWTDDTGYLWLFGGQEGHQDSDQGFRNDLWKYDVSNNQWTWMSGDSIIDQSAIYGVKGIANANNKPGARAGTESFKDKDGNLWLFGGGGYVSNVQGLQNDLWKYNIANNEWTWMSGDSALNELSVYGTKGVSSPANKPGSRGSAVSWRDNDGNFWVFGGLGYASTSERGALNDLWKYNISSNEWTWMGGDFVVNQPGRYGVKGDSDSNNKSGGREAGSGWTDLEGNFWLFGGYGYTSDTYSLGWMNDLWKYEPASNLWTWVNGDSIANQSGVYGTEGVTSESNKPGARSSFATFLGKTGELWLFGGYVVGDFNSGRINDLWKYEPATNLWTWMSGDQESWQEGVYGSKGVPDPGNKPGARDEISPWTDKDGDLWLFGGR
jgi:N-acetylneuraminic acid mutarotase